MPLLTPEELADAKNHLADLAPRSINKAVRFRNALQAFVRDVERHSRADRPSTVLAVDTSEIVAGADYDGRALSAFGFGSLLNGRPGRGKVDELRRRRAELERLDRMIVQHLLWERDDRFLLLDPHAEELAIVRQAKSRAADRSAATLYRVEMPEGLDVDRLLRIHQFIVNESNEIEKEWTAFRNRFLPNWRDEMFEALVETQQSATALNDLIRSDRYVYLRDTTFGDRALHRVFGTGGGAGLSAIGEDTVPAFRDFSSSSEATEEFANAHSLILEVLASISRDYKDSALVSAAAERDARALATLHVLNAFCHENRRALRFELVSRGPSIHDVMGALPEGRLHVTVRHPLLLPDIYRFDHAALASLSSLLGRVDTLLQPYLELDQTSLPQEKEDELEQRVSDVAQEVVELLKDVITVQHTREQSSEYYGLLTDRLIDQDSKRHRPDHSKKVDRKEVAKSVRVAFDHLAKRLRDRSDPFTRQFFRDLVSRNRDLVRFQTEQFGDWNLQVRLADFGLRRVKPTAKAWSVPSENTSAQPGSEEGYLWHQPSPYPCMAIQPIGKSFQRTFHVHSKRAADFIQTHLQQGPELPRDVAWRRGFLKMAKIVDELDNALSAIDDEGQPVGVSLRGKNARNFTDSKNKNFDEIVYNLDITLITCLAFASKGHFITAISLASTALQLITSKMHREERLDFSPEDARKFLCFRELFLLRHYCERGVALDDHFAEWRPLGPGHGSVDRNIARAQRDLDYAARMSECVESCLAADENEATPAGEDLIPDSRLRLAHLGGWIDQTLILADAIGPEWRLAEAQGLSPWRLREIETIRRRLDIWTAAGLVKEITLVAHIARRRRHSLETSEGPWRIETLAARRYLANMEAQALQGALMVLCLFLAYPISPDLQRLWHPDRPLPPQRLLVFRDWKHWWQRYRDLARNQEYDLGLRMADFLSSVMRALEEIDRIGREANPDNEATTGLETTATNSVDVLNNLQNALKNLDERSDGNTGTVRSALSSAFKRRTLEVIDTIKRNRRSRASTGRAKKSKG